MGLNPDPPSAHKSQEIPDQDDVLEAEDFDGSLVRSVGDATAPKFDVGDHHLSPNAIKQRSKRIFTRRVDGSLKVSEKIYGEWKSKGPARKTLEQIFKQCGYDPDSQLCLDQHVYLCAVHRFYFDSNPKKRMKRKAT